ncbi:MAG: cation:proton antiporter [Hyphomicrobiaceae bacterium]|nr:cation:proton antiporter [Hyphomicrobiaceae bacterium]
MASGGETPSLVQDMGIAIMVSGLFAVIFTRLKIPTIAAFLLAGFAVGPLGLGLVTDPANIDTIAQIGFVLLLFMIGLELDVRGLVKSGKALIVAGLVQYPLTLVFGLLVTQLLLMFGFGGLLAESPLTAFYIGAVIAGSSTIQVVKLFQQHFELDTQPGRIALALLIFQDLWAIVVTLVQPNLSHPEVGPILFSFEGIFVLLLIALLFSRVVISRFFHWISKSPELIVLSSLSWCFAVVFVGAEIDKITAMMGFNFHMAVGSGVSALIAGAVIANMPFSIEITTKVGILKDFFVTLFFVGLGISVPAITGWDVPILAVVMALIAVVSRQILFFPLLYWLGVDPRSAEVSSVRLAQISEFGLVIVFLGVTSGQLSPEFSSAVILAFVLTALATTPMFERAYAIYDRLRVPLNRMGFKEPEVIAPEESVQFEVAFLGLHRDASSLLHELAATKPEILPRVLVIDFNVALHAKIREMGVEVEYGDISNTETLLHAGIDKAKIIICTISDDLLRGINNLDLVRSVRAACPDAIIISNAVNMKAYEEIMQAGADYVYMARVEVAEALLEMLDYALQSRLEDYRTQLAGRRLHPTKRKEVLD